MSLLWNFSHIQKVPTHPLTILKYVSIDYWPGFAVGGYAHRRVSSSRFYWKQDLIEMGQKLAELDGDIDLGKPRAQERLDIFRKKRKGLVDSIIQVGLYSAVSILLSAHVGLYS